VKKYMILEVEWKEEYCRSIGLKYRRGVSKQMNCNDEDKKLKGARDLEQHITKG
jgi:hypothetical protein